MMRRRQDGMLAKAAIDKTLFYDTADIATEQNTEITCIYTDHTRTVIAKIWQTR